MTGLLDTGGLRLAGYVAAAFASAFAGWRERRSPTREQRDLWPPFWFITALMLTSMGIARAVDLGGILSDIGRDQAVSGGWYETRRLFQAMMVGGVAAVWIVTVLVAIWRVPARRGRYLPAAIVVCSLVCFAAVRVVSLHHVDALLYNRDVAGVRLVAVTELSLLTGSIASMFWFPFAERSTQASTAENSTSSTNRRPTPT